MINESIALIPCRGGSKGIPRKNLQLVGGVPLVCRTINTAIRAGIESVYVSTEDPEIAAVSVSAGAQVISRPSELASDESPTDLVIEHAAQKFYEGGFDKGAPLFLLQATSPFLSAQTLIEMYERTKSADKYICITTAEWHGVLWENLDGQWLPLGHNKSQRLRRQDMKMLMKETGAAYLSRLGDSDTKFKRKMRTVLPYPTSLIESLEIDSQEDLDFCRRVAKEYNL